MDDREPAPARTAATTLRWVSVSSVLEEPLAAAEQAAATVRSRLGEGPVDLLLAFFTAPFVLDAEAMAETLRGRLQPRCFAAVSAQAVIAAEREIESGPALVLLAGQLPGVAIHPFVLIPPAWGDAMSDAGEFARHTSGVDDAEIVLLFGDPFSLDVERVLGAFRRHAPTTRVVGGMASAAARPEGNTLILNDWLSHDGGIAISLGGALRADVVVSQGCRAVGPPLEVTQADGNVIPRLDGRPALERAEEVLRELPEAEQEQLQHGLYLGRPTRGGATGPGDYLIRNLLGADRERGAIAVADRVRVHEQVRLHVRDARIAREDLELLLSPQVVDSRAGAALIFSCNGRGRDFFGEPHADVTMVQSALGGAVPAAGFFCAGEIGPVGGENFLHGHTASIAILRSRLSADDVRAEERRTP
jgi:small ligand-binding sensory domain FIST